MPNEDPPKTPHAGGVQGGDGGQPSNNNDPQDGNDPQEKIIEPKQSDSQTEPAADEQQHGGGQQAPPGFVHYHPFPMFQVPYNLNSSFTAQPGPQFAPIPYFNPNQSQTHFATASTPRKLVDLPQFDGSADQWSAFITAYRTTNDVYAYNSFENHSRLRKAITGEAFKEVQGLLINPANVADVISRLEKVFAKPDTLVKAHIDSIRRTPPIRDSNSLILFSRDLTNMVGLVRAANAASRLADYTLLDELIGKLSIDRREDWMKYYVRTLNSVATIPAFATWLEEEADILRMARAAGPRTEPEVAPVNVIDITSSVVPPTGNRRPCKLCPAEFHRLIECPVFIAKNIEDRWAVIKEHRLCFGCLKGGHNLTMCNQKRNCGTNNCTKPHNKLLHSDAVAPAEVMSIISNNPSRSLYKYIPVTVRGPNGSQNAIVFIDDGSRVSLIDQELANSLGLRGQKRHLKLRWWNESEITSETIKTEFEIVGHGINTRNTLSGVFTVDNMKLPEQSLNFKKSFPNYNFPVKDYERARPQIVLGISHAAFTRPLKSIEMAHNFVAQETPIGWTVYGGASADEKLSNFIGHVELVNDDRESAAIAREYFEIDRVISNKTTAILTPHEKHAMDTLIRTTAKESGQYNTGLLWEGTDITLPTAHSYNLAYSRLRSIERQMEKDHELAEWYTNKIQDYIAKGYAIKLDPMQVSSPAGPVWYLPHFATRNPNKGNKRRMVFDAAAEANGVSLNNHLHKGPREYQPNPLLNVLFHFREHAFAVCADIKEMFHRVTIRPEDRDAQRFLWRDGDTTKPVETYVMRAMIFGSKSSPCSAQYVMTTHAEQYRHKTPRAVEAIVKYHYVDDYVDSFETEEEAIRVAQEVVPIHKEAGFELRGFLSNSTALLSDLNSEQVDRAMGGDETQKILGLIWNTKLDEYLFKLEFSRIADDDIRTGKKPPTRSQALSIVMSVFDPFGFLADIMIQSKLILRQLWTKGNGWREPIPDELFVAWQTWLKSLEGAKDFRLPRCYSPYLTSPDSKVQLHIFTDASNDAYAAVAYWRIVHGATVSISFIMGKCRTVPRLAPSIPKLELQAALLGSQIRDMIGAGHAFSNYDTILWSDSKTVIQWIHNPDGVKDRYITSRLFEMDLLKSRWRWVPGKDNPADIATRPYAKNSQGLWLTGPPFLLGKEDDWPQLPEQIYEDIGTCATIDTIEDDDPALFDFTRFSKFGRLIRAAAWVRRAIMQFKGASRRLRSHRMTHKLPMKKKFERIDPLTVIEISTAERLICTLAQKTGLAPEYNALKNNTTSPHNSRLRGLNPYLEDGLLRVGGRLEKAAHLPHETRHQIILPKDGIVTRLMIHKYHEHFYHQNTSSVIATIRTKFWIPSLKRAVKKVEFRCQLCKINRAKPEQPMMACLPTDRVTPYVRPFSYTGIDFAGPFSVCVGRRNEKRWIALFTCLTTRGIHLEVAKDMSTESALLCINNFVNRRGVPVRIRSDRGTNFVGASKEINKLIQEADPQKNLTGDAASQEDLNKVIQNACAVKGIEWIFNVPANPASGGAWERLVQSVKKTLAFSLKDRSPQLETLVAATIEAENLINSRPLTDLPLAADDDDPITPNQLILGTPNQIQTPMINANKVCLRRQLKIKNDIISSFWKQWILDYLPTLTRRTKWDKDTRKIEVGDVVIIWESNAERRDWAKGRVIKVTVSRDGRIRSAKIRTATGVLVRPSAKLARLDVQPEGVQDVEFSTF